jgi:hypothetical protein
VVPLVIASQYARNGTMPHWAEWLATIDGCALLLWIVFEGAVRWRRNRVVSLEDRPRLPR